MRCGITLSLHCPVLLRSREIGNPKLIVAAAAVVALSKQVCMQITLARHKAAARSHQYIRRLRRAECEDRFITVPGAFTHSASTMIFR